MISHSDAIVLRCIDYSNTSQIATLLTAAQGKISIIAKGIKRQTKNKCSQPLGVLNCLSVVYYQRHVGQMAILKEYSLNDHFPGIRAHLDKIFSALYWLELIGECTSEGEASPALFTALRSGLEQLDRSSSPAAVFLLGQWQFLKFLGLSPHLESCMACQAPVGVNGEIAFLFSPQRGGTLCARCCKDGGMAVRLSASSCRKLSALSTGEPATLTAREYQEIYSIFRFHLRSILNKDLRLTRYLVDYPAIAR